MIYMVIGGSILGLLLRFVIIRMLRRRTCIGDIVISKSEDKTIFSLEVNDFLERVEHEKEVYFRVVVSIDESDREQN